MQMIRNEKYSSTLSTHYKMYAEHQSIVIHLVCCSLRTVRYGCREIMLIHRCIIVALLVIFLRNAQSTIWIKNIRSQGPAAAIAGTKCLATLSKYYFYDPSVTRTKNLVISYTRHISSPANEIQQQYLEWLHQIIADGDMEGMQLQLISDYHSIDGIANIQTNAIYETDYYVLIMDNFTKFKRVMLQYVSRAASFNPGAKFIILFNSPIERGKSAEHHAKFAFQLFSLMYKRYNVANVIFLYATDVEKYSVYVTNPYRNVNECGSLKPIQLDECVAGVLGNTTTTVMTVRRSKVPKTLPNCTFTICARVTEPYINGDCKTGLEIQIIKVLQDMLRFKINTICTDMNRGEQFDNGSWSDLLGMLRNDECDFVVGGFFPDFDVHDDFGVTNTYFQDSYTWYVYIAPLQPSWLGLITIFQYYTWMVFVGMFLLSAITWYLLGLAMPEQKPHKRIAMCMLNSWSVFLCISANNRPEWSSLRVFFIMLALYGLTVTTIYTSKLITVFTSPAYEEQIDTIEEIIDSGLPIGGREEYHDWFENDNPADQIFFDLYNQSEAFLPSEENLYAVRDGKRVLLLNRIFVLSKTMDDIFPLPGDVLVNPLEMISENGFPLLKPFSRLISQMIDSGIIDKLYTDFLYNVTTLENIRDRSKIVSVSQIVLTMNHLSGAFSAWLLGLGVSFSVLLAELTIAWYGRKRRAKKLWQILKFRSRHAIDMENVKKSRKIKRDRVPVLRNRFT